MGNEKYIQNYYPKTVSFGGPNHRWKVSIELGVIGYEQVEWINPAQHRI